MTARDKVSIIFAKKMGWWDLGINDFCSSAARNEAYEFADLVLGIVRNT